MLENNSNSMTAHPPAVSLNRFESVIDDLPDEVLEYILSLVPPYKDLHVCALVCKRWLRSVRNVIRHTQKNLYRAITDFNVMWEHITPGEMAPTITRRYSHSACRYENSMYVFGGCTSTSTTFNDLWRLDLNKRQWVRPLTMGTYPSPKACASIVCYKETLILFGGWTHPSPYPLHQAWRLFNELHVYSIVSNHWSCINTVPSPPAMAGHSATVQGNIMVVFGGLHKTNYMGQYGSSNDVWCLNLENQTWYKQTTSEAKPHARYGQSQVSLDDYNMLILGGCGGPNMVFSDVWLLSMTEPVWTWQEIIVRNQQWSPAHMWCHPACKIGQRVVVFSRHPVSSAPALPYTAQWNTPSQLRINNEWIPPREDDFHFDIPRRISENVECNPVDRDQNVNGRRGTLRHQPLAACSGSGEDVEADNAFAGPSGNDSPQVRVPSKIPIAQVEQPHNISSRSFINPENPEPSTSGGIGMAAFRDPSPPLRIGVNRNRQRQLESLRRMEERIRNMSRSSSAINSSANVANSSNSSSSSSSGNGNSNSNQNNQLHPELPRVMSNCFSSPAQQFPSGTKTHVPKNSMTMFVLDVSKVLSDECCVEWLPLKNDRSQMLGPEEMILYTLVAGKGELIMFGGIQKDATSITAQAQLSSSVTNLVSNSLYFIAAPKGII